MTESPFVLPSFRVDGRLAAVTGASRGLGRAIAIGLAAAGADVAVTDLTSAMGECDSVAQEVEALGRRALALPLDVRDRESAAAAVDAIVKAWGGLDIWVNNAGIIIRKPALELAEEDWDAVVNVDLKGVFLGAQAAARAMVERGGGKIINIASINGMIGSRTRARRLLRQQGGGDKPDPDLGAGVGDSQDQCQRRGAYLHRYPFDPAPVRGQGVSAGGPRPHPNEAAGAAGGGGGGRRLPGQPRFRHDHRSHPGGGWGLDGILARRSASSEVPPHDPPDPSLCPRGSERQTMVPRLSRS